MDAPVPPSLQRSGWTGLPDRHAGLLVALASALLCLPFVRSVWLLADEGIWLHAAQRMIGGQILYRDFFEFHPPLGFLLVAGWMALFGSSLLAVRLLILLVIALTAWLAFSCCRLLSGRPVMAALLTLGWVAACQGPWTQINHHWFTSLFSMMALRAMLSTGGGRAPAWAAGLAASAATLVTTHRGGLIVLAGFVALLMRGSWRATLHYMVGGLALLIAILAFLAMQGTLIPALDQVVLFALNHYSDIQAVPFGAFWTLQTAPVVAVFPLVACLLALALHARGRALLRRPCFAMACWFALAGFLGCFPRPDAVHIAFCAVLALPLLAALLDSLLPRKPGPALIGLAALIGFMPLLVLLLSAVQVGKAPLVDTAVGKVRVVAGNGTAELLDRLKTLPAADPVFFYPYDPVLPFLSARDHPADLDLFVPQYTTPAQYRGSCLQLMRDARWVVFDEEISRPAFYRRVFPAMRNPSPLEKVAFEAALTKGFVEEGRYGGFRLLRRGAASAALCRAIPAD